MPCLRQPPLRALLMTALLTTLLTTLLTSCVSGNSAARTVAERYVDLIATADAVGLQELWALNAADDFGKLRAAGDLLPGASERIEVVEVGEATAFRGDPFTDLPAFPTNLDSQGLVQVPVRYQLAGTEHEAVVVLGSLHERSAADLASWRVVRPLTGVVTIAASSSGGTAPDAYLSGVRVMADNSWAGGEVQTYPAVYGAQLRADPYLASKTEEITMTPDVAEPFPELEVAGTEKATDMLRRQVLAMFARCESDVDDCPTVFSQLARDTHGDDWSAGSWRLRLVTKPSQWTVRNDQVSYHGGRVNLAFSDGTKLQVRFDGTSPWRFDARPLVPTLSRPDQTTIEVLP